MVTHRFFSQKETRNRLTYLRGLTEEDKRKLETNKSDLIAQLEVSKFTAEVKSKEMFVIDYSLISKFIGSLFSNMEEADELKTQIELEEVNSKEIAKKLEESKATKERIMKSLQEIYNSLKEFNLNEERIDTEGKDINHIALLFVEDAMIAANKLAQQKHEVQLDSSATKNI
jgi:hypothetical protein